MFLGFHLCGWPSLAPFLDLVSQRGELVVEREAGAVRGPAAAAAVMLLPPANLLEVAGKKEQELGSDRLNNEP